MKYKMRGIRPKKKDRACHICGKLFSSYIHHEIIIHKVTEKECEGEQFTRIFELGVVCKSCILEIRKAIEKIHIKYFDKNNKGPVRREKL